MALAKRTEEKEKVLSKPKEEIEANEVAGESAKEATPKFDIFTKIKEKLGPNGLTQIEMWKTQYSGDVFATVLGKGDLFIFRSIRRLEWREMQEELSKSNIQNEALFQEKIVKKCTLYPSLQHPEAFALLKAGSVSTLFEQITFYSNFVDPSIAVNIVFEL